ncbi:hypothetical protein amrb99_80670 [Actinomadura sp. RB99]|uniref:hypothetical protein n=1 Tax=Actinomadura sp. RB99 TaxID=2691577 RepID=UPI0016832982|nr:hypothetical protein [Actinomadura sp. RB99]MBD2899085.1 hypothetical protein [Actinomadura sp. RB99]
MGRKTERSRRARKRRDLALRLERPPRWATATLLISSFLLAVEFLLAPLSFVRNGGKTLTVDTATVTSCHRDAITGWAQYGCALEKDGAPYEPSFVHRPRLKTWRPVHGKVTFEIREVRGKAGTSYEIVKKGTSRPSFIWAVLCALVYFGAGGAIFLLLLKLLKGCAGLLRRSADRATGQGAVETGQANAAKTRKSG